MTRTTEFATYIPSFVPAYDELSGRFSSSISAGGRTSPATIWRAPINFF